MKNTTKNKETKHYYWMDLIKVIAIFLVVSNHCTDNVTPIERSSDWYVVWGTFYNSFTRPAIPLFVMVTGALLLPLKMEITTFYRKRMLRVLVPFLVWSFIYNLFPWFTGLLGLDSSVINDFFKWVEPSQAFGDAFYYLWRVFLNFSYFAVQMWYVYVLIGLYLLIPFVSTWLKNVLSKEFYIFIILWIITLFIPYLRQLFGPLWGVCSWNEFGTFYNFAGFSGYLLLGYHLKNNPIRWRKTNMLLITIPMFVVGYIITYFGFKSSVTVPNQTEEMVELFFTYCSINVFMMTIPVFLWCQRIVITSKFSQLFLRKMSGAMMGIWMCHYLFVGPAFWIVESLPLHTLLKLFLSTSIALIFSTIFTLLIKRIGRIGHWIMG